MADYDVELSPTPGETHDVWVARVTSLAGVAQNLLKEPLSPNPNTLRDQATQAEDYSVQVSVALSESSAWLDFHKAAEITKIDRDLTVPERMIHLDVAVMMDRMLRDKLDALVMALRSRMRRCAWHS